MKFNQFDITIRSICPDTLKAVVKLHMEAFANAPNTGLGEAYAEKMIEWFTVQPDSIALVALGPNFKVKGYLLGSPTGYSKKISVYLLWPAIKGLLKRPWLLLDSDFRMKCLSRIRHIALRKKVSEVSQAVLPPPCFSLVAIGVDVDARGQGIGRKLLQELERLARSRGMKSMRLTVRRDNLIAISAYTKCGWKIESGISEFASTEILIKRLSVAE